MPGNTNLSLAPDRKRFAVFPKPATEESEEGPVHLKFLLNFVDDLGRRVKSP
jgi:hypothetical protein